MSVRLKLEKVTKVYASGSADSVVAVEDTSFQVMDREFFVLLGPSGCGKSTLLSMMAGLERPTEGLVTLDDNEIKAPPDNVALMFQNPVLLPWKTTRANVMLPESSRSWKRPSEASKARARDALASVGLGDFSRAYPWTLSGGMQRRVALARLIFQDSDVLLMDEPFSALDEFTRFQLNVLLRRIVTRSGKTVVLVTHNIEEAVLLADRIAILTPRPGRLAETIAVDLPIDRTEEVMATEAFSANVRHVRQVINDLHLSSGTDGGIPIHPTLHH
jgi:NitT/TauT family transport system ATP-binding protein